MSSLLKSSYWMPSNNKTEPETRVIDSNELVASKIEAILASEKEINRETSEDGFVSGLEAETVEMLLEEEKTPQMLLEEAEQALEQARHEADMILADANKLAEEVKNTAYEQGQKAGYEDGYHKAMAEGEELKEQLKEEAGRLELDYHQRLEEMEPLLLDKILEVLDGALAVKLLDDKEILLHLLKKNLGQVGSSESFLIRVSAQDIEVLRGNRDLLMRGLAPGTRLEFAEEASFTPGMCRLETDGGVFDCSLDGQYENLKKNLRLLASNPNL